jgi:hypothetical protein
MWLGRTQPIDSAEVPAYIGAEGVDNRPLLHEARDHLESVGDLLRAEGDLLKLGEVLPLDLGDPSPATKICPMIFAFSGGYSSEQLLG